jgi:DNA-binding GntR family transcriptional regulator
MSPSVQTVNHRSPTPLFVQLANLLREDIRTGRLRKDSHLPSEPSLMQAHSVSRGTVRKALELLRDEGLITTLPGRHSFVN